MAQVQNATQHLVWIDDGWYARLGDDPLSSNAPSSSLSRSSKVWNEIPSNAGQNVRAAWKRMSNEMEMGGVFSPAGVMSNKTTRYVKVNTSNSDDKKKAALYITTTDGNLYRQVFAQFYGALRAGSAGRYRDQEQLYTDVMYIVHEIDAAAAAPVRYQFTNFDRGMRWLKTNVRRGSHPKPYEGVSFTVRKPTEMTVVIPGCRTKDAKVYYPSTKGTVESKLYAKMKQYIDANLKNGYVPANMSAYASVMGTSGENKEFRTFTKNKTTIVIDPKNKSLQQVVHPKSSSEPVVPPRIHKVAFVTLLKCAILRMMAVDSSRYYTTHHVLKNKLMNMEDVANAAKGGTKRVDVYEEHRHHARVVLRAMKALCEIIPNVVIKKHQQQDPWPTRTSGDRQWWATASRVANNLFDLEQNTGDGYPTDKLAYFLDKFREGAPITTDIDNDPVLRLSMFSRAHYLTQRFLRGQGIRVYMPVQLVPDQLVK